MVETSRISVKSERMLSNAEAYLYISNVIERIREKEGTVPLLLIRTLEYLKKNSGVSPEKAEEVRKYLESRGLRPETIVMLMNICPQSLEEALPILELEPKRDEELLKDALSFLEDKCVTEERV